MTRGEYALYELNEKSDKFWKMLIKAKENNA